jgi:hypothetical protein
MPGNKRKAARPGRRAAAPAVPAFPVGFWNYVNVEGQDAAAVRDWADAGITLTMGPECGPERTHVRRMHVILDAAAQHGIRIIVCDRRSRWRELTAGGEVAYRRGFAAALKDYGRHPAVFGFHVGDEPDAAAFADACRAMRLAKEMAPGVSPFLNLLPWHQGCAPRVGFTDWASYLDAYVREARPDFLCYDCYAQMNPGQEGWHMYFRNLREYLEAGRRHGLAFWTTLLSVGHFRYRPPREDDLRWQVSTALAHGARGLLWFFMYMRRPHDNYRVPPIDEHGERTETFAWLSRVNRSFLKGPAAVFAGLALQRVSHVGHAWGGFPAFEPTELVAAAKSLHGTDLVVSEFADAAGCSYVVVVNNSQTESTQAELVFRGTATKLWRIGWEAKEEPVAGGDGWKAAASAEGVRIRPWLAPGQLELYRVESGG